MRFSCSPKFVYAATRLQFHYLGNRSLSRTPVLVDSPTHISYMTVDLRSYNTGSDLLQADTRLLDGLADAGSLPQSTGSLASHNDESITYE